MAIAAQVRAPGLSQKSGEVPVPMPASIDACPGIVTLHPARDGHVARIRLPGGYVTRRQWAALAALAGDLGDGCLDLTARGNLQLRGLPLSAAAELASRAARAGLLPSGAHDRARNITASPLAGLGGHPPLRRIVRALDAALIDDPALTALPGRFLCATDDGTGGALLAESDIGLRRAGRHVEMIIAGRSVGLRLPVSAAIPAVLTAARVAVACGVGSLVTRIRDLADGGSAVAASIGGSLGPRLPADGTRLPLGAGVVPGSEVLVVAAPLGRLASPQLGLTGSLLRAGDVIRLAAAGRLVIPLAGRPRAALADLAAAGLLTSDDDELAGVTACSGIACSKAVADVRAMARPLPGHPRTHWVACARGCGTPQDATQVIATGPDSFVVAAKSAHRPLALTAGVS